MGKAPKTTRRTSNAGIRRPARLDGLQAFLQVRVGRSDKQAFIAVCRGHRVGASQVIREAMLAIISGQWTPPSLRNKSASAANHDGRGRVVPTRVISTATPRG
jgi:hypothetical protein